MYDLKTFRKINNLTQKELAKYFGCKQAFISQIEVGARNIPDSYISKILQDRRYKQIYTAPTINDLVNEPATPYPCKNCEFLRGQIYQLSEQNLKYEEKIMNLCIEISDLRRSLAEREASTG